MNPLTVDLGLVEKYNVPGPRYTSYPPATFFQSDMDRTVLESEIVANSRLERDLSLYFHLPFCWSLCWYCGCTTVITGNQKHSAAYIQGLEQELELMDPLLGEKRRVVQLHFGGGTPNFLLPEEILHMGHIISSHFDLASGMEAGVELDPRSLTKEHVDAFQKAGFNRASIGVQDNNPKVQKAVHRIQPREQTEQAFHWLRNAGFKSVNIDLIYGLPHQTVTSFEQTLEDVLSLKPDRIAVFSYAHVPWIKPAQRLLTEEQLPAPGTKLELLKRTIETLTSSGYVYIGMDHFARDNDELVLAQSNKSLQRNFQGYSTCGATDIVAFGMSAISQSGRVYWQNEKTLPAYYNALNEHRLPWAKGYLLTAEEEVRRVVIHRLMCDLGLDFAALSEELGMDFHEYFSEELEAMQELQWDGLVLLSENALTVTNEGRLFLRNIAMRFDPNQAESSQRRYSQTI